MVRLPVKKWYFSTSCWALISHCSLSLCSWHIIPATPGQNGCHIADDLFRYIFASVAYRYRKSISIIELFVSIISIYIVFLATTFNWKIHIVNPQLVRAITHHPLKLGSPNLDHRCKRPWLRSLLFWGWLTLTFKVKFNFKVKSYPILSFSAG